MDPYTFPGATPFIIQAAEELGVVVQHARVQRIAAIQTLGVLAAQVGAHPEPAVLIAHSVEFISELQVALLAAQKMVGMLTASIAPPSAADAAPAVPDPVPTPTPAPQAKAKK